jgi:hypothetical protein
MNKIATKSKAGAVKWHLFNGFQIDPGHAAEIDHCHWGAVASLALREGLSPT